MRHLFKFSIAALALGALMLVANGLHAMDITTPESSDINLDINGFMTISPGILFIDASENNASGDPDPQFPEISLETRIHFTIGTDDFKITGAQWTRDDAIICRNVGTPSATGKADCQLNPNPPSCPTNRRHLHRTGIPAPAYCFGRRSAAGCRRGTGLSGVIGTIESSLDET
ncbi:MAG: hypothetical protein IIA40_02090 [SAR324 cluster bacterium]|nr:hypothetical protein [SAR324 cluster bacterium]